MNAPELLKPEERELVGKATGALAIARDLKIATTQQYTEAGFQLKLAKSLQQQIAAAYDPHIKRAHDAHKALVAAKNEALKPALDAESTVKRALLSFQQEQERQRQEFERKAREAAEKEQARIREQAAKAEAAARAKADELRRQQEEAERAGKAAEAARLGAKAANVEAAGAEKVAGLQDKAAMISTPVVQVETPKVAGISTRETWEFEIVDEALIPRQYMSPDEGKIRPVVRALKSAANIPGIRVFTKSDISSRSA